MAISYVGALGNGGSVEVTTGSTLIVNTGDIVGPESPLQVGDLILLFAASPSSSHTVTPDSGWQLVGTPTHNNSGVMTSLFWKFADADDVDGWSYVFTRSSSTPDPFSITLAAFRGVHRFNPILYNDLGEAGIYNSESGSSANAFGPPFPGIEAPTSNQIGLFWVAGFGTGAFGVAIDYSFPVPLVEAIEAGSASGIDVIVGLAFADPAFDYSEGQTLDDSWWASFNSGSTSLNWETASIFLNPDVSVPTDRDAAYRVQKATQAPKSAPSAYRVRSPGSSGKTASYAIEISVVVGANSFTDNISDSGMEVAPVGSLDLPIKGPNSLFITVDGIVMEMPDEAKRLMRMNNAKVTWTYKGSSGAFIYRQEV